MSLTVNELTAAERLLIWRRRQEYTQVQAAKHFVVPVGTYRDWEAGRKTETQPRIPIGKLAPHEICFILRRRSDKKQREVAAALGVTRLWVIRMEEGRAAPDRLCAYWGL